MERVQSSWDPHHQGGFGAGVPEANPRLFDNSTFQRQQLFLFSLLKARDKASRGDRGWAVLGPAVGSRRVWPGPRGRLTPDEHPEAGCGHRASSLPCSPAVAVTGDARSL